MNKVSGQAVRMASLRASSFDSERAPVALLIDAAAVLASDCLLARELDGLQGLASATTHLSIRLIGPPDARAVLAGILEDALPSDVLTVWRSRPGIADVLPRCPLLSAELGDCAWSRVGLLVPPETAWVAVDIDLQEFLGADARVDRARLGEHLDATLLAIDGCYDSARWPTPRMQQDAWENRRVAIRPSGFEALLHDGDYSPPALHQLTGWISARLQAGSQRLAASTRPLPSIRDADPASRMPASPRRDEWRRRWLKAVETSSVRHRNLLALSADSLVTRDPASGRLSFELLGLLQHADTVAAPPEPRAGCDAAELAAYRRRLAAALQQRHSLDQIAKLV